MGQVNIFNMVYNSQSRFQPNSSPDWLNQYGLFIQHVAMQLKKKRGNVMCTAMKYSRGHTRHILI